MKPFRENNFVARCFIWVAVCIRVSTTSTSWNKFSVTNGSCLFRSACFYFNLLIYFVISRLIYSFSCFCYQFSLRGWKNIKIKIRCFKVLLWTKKEHHYTIKVFIVWKNPSTLNGKFDYALHWKKFPDFWKNALILAICWFNFSFKMHISSFYRRKNLTFLPAWSVFLVF